MNFNIDKLGVFGKIYNANGTDTLHLSTTPSGKERVSSGGTYKDWNVIFRKIGRDTAANNEVRTKLLVALGNACGVKQGSDFTAQDITDDFMDQMEALLGKDIFKRDDFGLENGKVTSGRPLTERRITAIVSAVRVKAAVIQGAFQGKPIAEIRADHAANGKTIAELAATELENDGQQQVEYTVDVDLKDVRSRYNAIQNRLQLDMHEIMSQMNMTDPSSITEKTPHREQLLDLLAIKDIHDKASKALHSYQGKDKEGPGLLQHFWGLLDTTVKCLNRLKQHTTMDHEKRMEVGYRYHVQDFAIETLNKLINNVRLNGVKGAANMDLSCVRSGHGNAWGNETMAFLADMTQRSLTALASMQKYIEDTDQSILNYDGALAKLD